MAKGSSGRHGGGHKDRQRGANASDKREADRNYQFQLASERGKSTDGRKGKPDGRKPKSYYNQFQVED